MRWHAPWTALILLSSLACLVECLRGSELVLAAKAKAAEEKLNPTTEEIAVVVNDDGSNSTVVKSKPLLTGIPQKDYIYDPNLPRELNGYNLSDYPFYNGVPKDIEFECDGLLDGFYASVPHHCQVYHHCLFGTRYDFLCANYTAFDQKTFICHFVSEVDCNNSPKYYKRNEALYKQATTTPAPTTKAPTTTTTTTTTTETPARKGSGGKRRRPFRRRRPMYEYYYDDEEELYDEEYYEDDAPPRKSNRRHQRPSGGRKQEEPSSTTSTTTTTSTTSPSPVDAPLTRAPLSVYAPRVPPKIKRPVPINEKSKYEYTTKAGSGPSPTSDPNLSEEEDYYDDEEDYDLPPKKKESGKQGRRRSQHNRNDRKRPSRYDDDEYEDEDMDERPRMKKRNRNDDDVSDRGRPGTGKGRKGQRDDDSASDKHGSDSAMRSGSRKRYPDSRPERRRPNRRPAKGYDYYEDEEEEEEDISRHDEDRRRPNRPKHEKSRPRAKKPPTTTPVATTTSTSTTTTTTTTTTTPKPTSKSTSLEDEEYDDYEYEYDSEEAHASEETTSPSPHRFSSTVGYKNIKSTAPAATETPLKTKNYSFRPRKPEVRKSSGNTEQVNSQSNYKKPEDDSGPKTMFRRPLSPSTEDTNFKRPARPETHPYQSENNNQRTRSRDESTSADSAPAKKPAQSHVTGPDGSNLFSNIRRSKPEQQDPKRPIDEIYNRKPPTRQDPPPTAPDNLRNSYSRPESLPQMNSGGSQVPYQGSSFLRRPVPSTGPQEQTLSSPPTGLDNLDRRSGSQAGTGSEVKEQNFRKPVRPIPFTSPGAADLSRRPSGPDGVTGVGSNFRRGRPIDKGDKKTLQELAYPSRRPPTSPEPVTESPPFKFRSHYSNTRPVVEGPEYFKPPKSVEFTAPGPSGIDGSSPRPASAYDLEDEYDVTLNDALQPSTLNPTIQFTRVKSRGYQTAVTHPSYRSVLMPSASQNYYSKTAVGDQGSFETVILPATSRFSQASYKTRRPAEWYW